MLATSLAFAAGAPGATCVLNGDCIDGSHCDGGVCELPGPCAATIRSTGEPVVTERYDYDDELRKVLHERTQEGEVTHRTTLTWTDGVALWKNTTILAWRPDPVDYQRVSYDRLGQHSRLEQGSSPDRLGMVTDFSYREDCSGADFTWTDSERNERGTRVNKCADGLPVVAVTTRTHPAPAETVQTRTYTRESRRLKSVLFERPQGPPVRVTFVRSAAGYQIGERQDIGDDGTIDSESIWDLSCWDIQPDAVRRKAP